MTVILTILKIIGWLLLILLLLLIVVVLLLLFYPVGYRVRGSICQKQINGSIRVYWLFHLFSFCLTCTEGRSSMYVRLFGFKKMLSSEAEGEAGTGQPEADSVVEKEEEEPPQEQAIPRTDTRERAKGHVSSEPEKDTLFEKIRQKWKRFLRKLSDIRRTAERFRQMAEDTKNRAAVSHLKKEVFRLLKCILPGRLFLDMSYSTGSPDTTAQVFGILALFPIGYQNRWHIRPDFEADAAYIEGSTDTKGHIYMVQMAGIFLRLITDKNCRRLYRQFTKIKS